MSSLNIDPELPLEEGLALYDANLAKSFASLQQSGFYMPHEPTYSDAHGQTVPYRGQLPPDLSPLTDDNLMWYLNMLATWNAYVQTKMAEADLNRTTAKDKLEFLEAKLKAKMILARASVDGKAPKKLSNPEADAVVKCDRRYVDLKTALNYYEASYKIIRAAGNGADKAWDTVSRRITQRGQEIERDRRSTPSGPPIGGPMFGARSSRRTS